MKSHGVEVVAGRVQAAMRVKGQVISYVPKTRPRPLGRRRAAKSPPNDASIGGRISGYRPS